MKVTFEKSKKSLLVTDGERILGCFVADSIVLSLAEHSRSRSNIARTYPDGLPYDPRPFPSGSWLITGHHISTNKYVTGAFIETNATRKVRVWSTRHAADGTVLELLCQYVSSYPSAEECALHVVTPEVIDTTGMEVVTISAQTQVEIDAANTKASLEAEFATLKGQCDSLDASAVRPLRAVAAGTATEEDRACLTQNEAAVTTKRGRIAEIKVQLGI